MKNTYLHVYIDLHVCNYCFPSVKYNTDRYLDSRRVVCSRLRMLRIGIPNVTSSIPEDGDLHISEEC